MKDNKGFNWMALIFAPMYYAGYGKIGMGLLFALIGIIPLAFIPVHFYAGYKANSDLAIGKTPFRWGSVAIVLVVMVMIKIISIGIPKVQELEAQAYKNAEAREQLKP